MNKFIKFLFYSLLLFLPLAFAGTEVWSAFIFQCVVTFLFIYILLTNKQFFLVNNSKIIISCFFILIFVAIVQSFNQCTIIDATGKLPFSLCSFYTLKEAIYFETLLLLFFISTQLIVSFKNIKQTTLVILFSSVIIMILGLFYQRGEYIKFLLGNNYFGSFGSFVNRNSAGAYLLLSFFVSLGYTLYNLYEYKKQQVLSQLDYVVKLSIQVLITLFFFICIIFVRSRGVYFATYISCFVLSYLLIFFIIDKRKLQIRYLSLITILLILSSSVIYINLDAINNFCYRQTLGYSELTRINLYSAAITMLKDYWMFGVGAASFPVAIASFTKVELDAWPQFLHNDWLELVLDDGYIISACIFILILLLCINLFKRIKILSIGKKFYFITLACSLFGFSVASLVDFHFHIPADSCLFFMILAILCAPIFYDKVLNFNINIIIKFVLIALSLLALLFSAKQSIAWKYSSFSKYLMLDSKIEYLEKAVSFSKNPRYLQELIATYYNSSINKNTTIQKQQNYRHKANNLAQKYLAMYPFDKKILLIYELSNKS